MPVTATESQLEQLVPPPGYKHAFPTEDGGIRVVQDGFRHVTICSVFPGNLVHEAEHCHVRLDKDGEPHVWNRTAYILPAAPRDGYRLLHVYDSAIPRRKPIWGAEPGQPQWEHLMEDKNCRYLAEQLMILWQNGMPGVEAGHKIGLAIIAGDEPTPAELTRLFEQQRRLWMWLIDEANRFYSVEKDRGRIGAFHMMAARELGLEGLQWMTIPAHLGESLKTCFGCRKRIKAQALSCDTCGDLIAYALKYGFSEEEVSDPVVWKHVSRVKAERDGKKKPVAAVSAAKK